MSSTSSVNTIIQTDICFEKGMKKETKSKPPSGMSIVKYGKVQLGDWAFAALPKKWKPLQDTEVGKPVSDYVAIARKGM